MRFVNVNVAALRRGQAQRPGAGGRRARRARRAGRGAGRLARRRGVERRAPPTRRARFGAGGRAGSWRRAEGALAHQAAVIGAINDAAGETGVVVCAAGSAPGDLHKLWRARDPDGKGYHVEYGYSCMGYEIPGGMGVKLAAPEREVFVLVGDGSYLMLPGELATAVAEGIPIVVVLVDNHGYASIGALSRSVGSAGFGTHYRRAANGAPAPRRSRRQRAGGAAACLARRPRGQRREPRRARAPRREHRRAARRAGRGPARRRPRRDPHRGRPLRGRAQLRGLVGRAGRRGLRRRRGARRARGVRAGAGRRSAGTWRHRERACSSIPRSGRPTTARS